MNRRQAIFGAMIGVGSVIGYFVVPRFYRRYLYGSGVPDLGILDQSRPLIAALVDVIIPRTDTPGAMDASVDEYVILMVKDCCDRTTQNIFVDGLKEVQKFSENKYERRFEYLARADQVNVLTHFQSKGERSSGIAGKIELRVFGRYFFDILKELTVKGFCTSEPGATQALVYVPIPGSFNGCIPLEAGQRSWAIN